MDRGFVRVSSYSTNIRHKSNDQTLLDELVRISLKCWNEFETQGICEGGFRVDSENHAFCPRDQMGTLASRPKAVLLQRPGKPGWNFLMLWNAIIEDGSQLTNIKPWIHQLFQFRTNVNEKDVDIVRTIVASTGFFYDFEIPVAVELVEDRLAGVRTAHTISSSQRWMGKLLPSAASVRSPARGRVWSLLDRKPMTDYRGFRHRQGIAGGNTSTDKEPRRKVSYCRNFFTGKIFSHALFLRKKNNYKQEALIPDFYKEVTAKWSSSNGSCKTVHPDSVQFINSIASCFI